MEKGNFEIIKWPQVGRRPLDPHTGDEAGTTEGHFDVHWKGDFYYGKNLAVSTPNNHYLDGLGTPPEHATDYTLGQQKYIYLWMSDYHPDGGPVILARETCPICSDSRFKYEGG